MVSCLIGRKMSNFKYHQKNILNPMSIHKITPFSLGYQKRFFQEFRYDSSHAEHKFHSLASKKMTERDTLAILSKPNCTYRLLTIFQCLLLFPCFESAMRITIRSMALFAPLVKARKDVFYRFMEKSKY